MFFFFLQNQRFYVDGTRVFETSPGEVLVKFGEVLASSSSSTIYLSCSRFGAKHAVSLKFSLHHSDRRCRPERREPPRWSTGPKTPLPVAKAATVDPGECRVSGAPVAGAAKHPPCTAAAAALCSPSECCGAGVTAGTPNVVDGSQVPALRGSATVDGTSAGGARLPDPRGVGERAAALTRS